MQYFHFFYSCDEWKFLGNCKQFTVEKGENNNNSKEGKHWMAGWLKKPPLHVCLSKWVFFGGPGHHVYRRVARLRNPLRKDERNYMGERQGGKYFLCSAKEKWRAVCVSDFASTCSRSSTRCILCTSLNQYNRSLEADKRAADKTNFRTFLGHLFAHFWTRFRLKITLSFLLQVTLYL